MAPLNLLLLAPAMALSAFSVEETPARFVATGDSYRVTLGREAVELNLDLRYPDGSWRPVATGPGRLSLAVFVEGREIAAVGARAAGVALRADDSLQLTQNALIDPLSGTVLELNYLCRSEGVLLSARLLRQPGAGAVVWCPPRIGLAAEEWDPYVAWDFEGNRHAGRLSELGPEPVYAGISPWEQTGDAVAALDPSHPALVIRPTEAGRSGLAAVYVGYPEAWAGSHMFLQRHTRQALFLYAGFAPAAEALRWAWLAPIPPDEPEEAFVERLVERGRDLVQGFTPGVVTLPREWSEPLPDFPADLRRPKPVAEIGEAAVYSINEYTSPDYGIEVARKAGSDVLIRGWFKWGNVPPGRWDPSAPAKAHEIGALFGGGITCSALYDGENGLTEDQWKDMATRGPAGQLIEAWDQPGCRHGSLSSPAYADYLFRWCREQIDAGADYLFMDEIGAALSQTEGHDDHSLADFREYLLHHAPQTLGWVSDDARWLELGVNPADPDVCPGGNLDTFDYRAFLRKKGVLDKPWSPENPLAALWGQFRTWRDDRAWKALTDRIRAYAADRGWTVYLSANGLARYVDLQVLGVWGDFRTKDGRADLSQSQLMTWRATVLRGEELAGRKVPVVFFHDWGFGEPPFPWLALPPSERELWTRVRGAEIYAAGAFYAFPVLGPFGCDAARDGTLPEIARQAAFFQQHRDLYLQGRYVGSEPLRSETPDLSLAAWWVEGEDTLALHVINRHRDGPNLAHRKDVVVEVPVAAAPAQATVVAPDIPGVGTATCELRGDTLRVTIPDLDAYAVACLAYPGPVDLSRLRDPARVTLTGMWDRPLISEFRVGADGLITDSAQLNGFLQGMLHTHLRNPPVFLVNAETPGRLKVMVRAVSQAGAKIVWSVDGRVAQTVDLPDLDGKNDGSAAEYDRVLEFAFPAGRHRLGLDNTGGDWATITWIEFEGRFAEW